MITALDTSVILDVLTDDSKHGSSSEYAVRQAQQQGKLIVCECVIAEIYPALNNESLLLEFVTDWQLVYSPIDLNTATLAGRYFSEYLSRGGKAKRVVPDFLIGAHATTLADRLLARDRGYLRDYFTSLEVWDPSTTA